MNKKRNKKIHKIIDKIIATETVIISAMFASRLLFFILNKIGKGSLSNLAAKGSIQEKVFFVAPFILILSMFNALDKKMERSTAKEENPEKKKNKIKNQRIIHLYISALSIILIVAENIFVSKNKEGLEVLLIIQTLFMIAALWSSLKPIKEN